MTDNPNRLPFSDMSRKDQDRIAGALIRDEHIRGEHVEGLWRGTWRNVTLDDFTPEMILRIAATAKPAKDPNRPRPAHKLNLKPGDVVMVYEIEDLVEADACGEIICLGETDTRGDWIMDRVRGRSGWLQWCIENPQEKGHRALFAVVSRAKA